MKVERFAISGPVHFTMPRFDDARGYFTESFNTAKLNSIGIKEAAWVQDNQSYSADAFTLRGLHFQLPPFAQAKIVRALAGRIFDVAVDLRPNSPSFGRWLGVELDAVQQNQLYVPLGFGHGFLTLTPGTVVTYKVSAPYAPAHDRSLNWADPGLSIAWPLPKDGVPRLSDKDSAAPFLEALRPELKDFA